MSRSNNTTVSRSTPTFKTPWDAAWQPEYVGTLNFVICADQVLLIDKKTGHGAGMINAPGGKLQANETVLQCALRETTEEEVGIIAEQTRCRAELRFVEANGPQWLGFVFISRDYQGEVRETDEARPFWQPLEHIPYSQMWPDDAIWLPRLLADEELFLVGNFLFDRGQLQAHEFVNERSIWQDLSWGEH